VTYNIVMKKTIPTLGVTSATLINNLKRSGKNIFTLGEAAEIYGKGVHATGKFLSTLLKRNIVVRIKSGVYLILQTGLEEVQLSNWPVIARELSRPNDYYIAYYSAMRIHGMTTHPLLSVYITSTKRFRDKKINNIEYHFIFSKKKNFWGERTIWVSKQEKVIVSDIERTILDGLERPELCGGLVEVIRGIWYKRKEIDWMKLKDYLRKFHAKSVLKRLGFILEKLDINRKMVLFLRKELNEKKDYVLLDPAGLKEGRYIKKWGLRLNMNIEEITESVWG
jgi:predicted transcriptional regulator of viral defense system